MKPTTLLLVLALLLSALAAPRPVRADDADNGVAIATGLAIAVVAVYALVGLQSDVERYSDAAPSAPCDLDAVMARAAATADRAPLAFVPVTHTPEAASTSREIAGAALALRTTF